MAASPRRPPFPGLLVLLGTRACTPPPGPLAPRQPRPGADGVDDTAADTAAPPLTATLSPGPVQACADPVPVERVDTTVALGLDTAPPPSARTPDGTGLLAADLDGDGDLDLAQSFEGRTVLRRHLRQGARFVTEDRADTEALQLVGVDGAPPFLAAGFTLSWMGGDLARGETVFDATPGFVRDAVVIEGLGVFVALSSSTGLAADRADRLVGGADLGAEATHEAFDAVLFDADGDGRRDLYVVNDSRGDPAVTHRLYRVDEGGLTDITAGSGLGLSMAAMGAAAGDVDGDGRDDVYLTGTGDSRLMLALGDGSFVDATAAWRANPMSDPTEMGWGVVIVDEDNDGDADVVAAHGDFGGDPPFAYGPQPVVVLRQGPERAFDERVDLEPGRWRTVLPLELNGDGVLDLVAVDVDGQLRAWTSTGCSAGAWLAVDAPDGSRVRVTAGDRTWAVTATVDAGYGGARPARAWIGLGEAGTVDRVEVVLPLGAGRALLEGPLEARRVLRLVE